jgi:DNA-binding MarR family transcriptional regulator
MRNISVGRNANGEQSNGGPAVAVADPESQGSQSLPLDRVAILQLLLEEMTAWSPRDRGGAFKMWHRHALSLVHLNVLTALEAEGALSMTNLAQAMDVSDASATGIVDRMEKRGLVERRHDTGDRRKVIVQVTETGRKVFSDMAEHRRALLAMILQELSEDEVASLLIGYRAITAARKRVLARELTEPATADHATTPA